METLGRVHLVTEWIRGGELYNRITQGGPLTESHAAPLYKQLLLAVKHMVRQNINFEIEIVFTVGILHPSTPWDSYIEILKRKM